MNELHPICKLWLWSSSSFGLKESFASSLHLMDQVSVTYWMSAFTHNFWLPLCLSPSLEWPLFHGWFPPSLFSVHQARKMSDSLLFWPLYRLLTFACLRIKAIKTRNISCSDPFLQMLTFPLGSACLFLVLQYLHLIIFLCLIRNLSRYIQEGCSKQYS